MPTATVTLAPLNRLIRHNTYNIVRGDKSCYSLNVSGRSPDHPYLTRRARPGTDRTPPGPEDQVFKAGSSPPRGSRSVPPSSRHPNGEDGIRDPLARLRGSPAPPVR